MSSESGSPAHRVAPLLRVRQVREFTAAPVATDALEAITDAARWSGSSRNSQPWRFVMIQDQEVLRCIAAAGQPQTRALETATAAVAIALVEEKGSAVSHAFDEGRAAERMLIAASLLGIGAGIAWVTSDTRPLVAELLGLFEGRFVRTIIAIGHPTEAARAPKAARGQARLPRSETVFAERYGKR
ncbi:MAG: nitroreductase family protein [Chloroflexota bacterium]|nr:nitroreductase family protein [Chloroflexota bacterium]